MERAGTKRQDISREGLYERAKAAGDFVCGDDGIYVYWPKGLGGALSEWMLRALADELEKMNASWAAQLERDMKAYGDGNLARRLLTAGARLLGCYVGH